MTFKLHSEVAPLTFLNTASPSSLYSLTFAGAQEISVLKIFLEELRGGVYP